MWMPMVGNPTCARRFWGGKIWMEYRSQEREPVTKNERQERRKRQRKALNARSESNRKRSSKGGQADELGVTQGQNAEQGNTFNPDHAKPIGRTSQH
jgi:hypothetical protein